MGSIRNWVLTGVNEVALAELGIGKSSLASSAAGPWAARAGRATSPTKLGLTYIVNRPGVLRKGWMSHLQLRRWQCWVRCNRWSGSIYCDLCGVPADGYPRAFVGFVRWCGGWLPTGLGGGFRLAVEAPNPCPLLGVIEDVAGGFYLVCPVGNGFGMTAFGP